MSRSINQVLVYAGHTHHPSFGPYLNDVDMQVQLFHDLNHYRKELGKTEWAVLAVTGECLVETLKEYQPESTLLVFPAGPSHRLEKVFSDDQKAYVNQFLKKGASFYTMCGGSYAICTRDYGESITDDRGQRLFSIQKSCFPFALDMIAKGPICPSFKANREIDYQPAVFEVRAGSQTCHVYVGGGGSFVIPESARNVKVLAKYLNEQTSPGREINSSLVNAAVLSRIGEGAIVASMFHPEYGAEYMDDNFQRIFKGRGDWAAVTKALSSKEDRLRFCLTELLLPLEERDF